MSRPILSRQELRRLPFQRRPVAEPGTRLVFQMSSGELVAPIYPYTMGDVWWRGPRAAYVVDTRPHAVSFQCQLPCDGDALHFDAAIGFAWSVHDPVVVVRELVADAVGDCRGYLIQRMRGISRRFSALDSEAAELAILRELGEVPVDLDRGLRISGLGVELRLDPEQAPIARDLEIVSLRQKLAEAERRGQARIDQIGQEADLGLHQERADFFARILAGGGASMAGNVLAQDASKAAEAANLMMSIYRQDQDVAIQAMKVVLDSDQVRIGELDDAVAAAVSRFKALLSPDAGKLSSGALTTSAAAQAPMLPSGPDPANHEAESDGGKNK